MELVTVTPGIIARFIPPSNLVDQALGLTAGRLEYPFGNNRETLRFGLQNQSEYPAELKSSDYIAYVEFYDLRGLKIDEVQPTIRDVKIFSERANPERFARANDDGPFYPSG